MDNLKQKWIEALRSGKYNQGFGFLKDGSGDYCCLGVLCEVAGLNEQKSPHVDATAFQYNEQDWDEQYLPYDFGIAIGLEENLQTELAEMNDEGKLFTEIADYIEQKIILKEPK